ncbi:hypothetical protein PC116_g17487 [Phytophthora cactorum]|nr:hypothetical protein PC113_g13848 [Phytophthora cactorum]KAG2876225.1 hypothetical protein PC114_g24307 [Phytophthora cactorum]KAG2891965.1 hypothetical protein PC117_g24129 [Phytophthora cactorum]KAG2897637.1 hypothetical protein PC114_g14601 [Phytophthora cactorum]KAG2928849.1 hypothetical protein PC117_g14162 [Phytophthora cactorum]
MPSIGSVEAANEGSVDAPGAAVTASTASSVAASATA